ncbi:uncharacterized protein LOC135167376 [Diachasmimorpha longicaudata]|uniref:uncharacterized protein LOC135167376 n=1 Tax=Diachasmimorpha longicaudata TaxID=58733 RepID=UPI0030B88358
MLRKVLAVSFITAAVTTAHIKSNYLENSSRDLIASALGLIEEFQNSDNNYESRSIHKRKNEGTGVQGRSYYGGTSPAFYPAFDPISILASLAFLAFLLQSFAALFDRSRSIIPAVISSRDSSAEDESPDPIELILRALEEYDVSNDINTDTERTVAKITK